MAPLERADPLFLRVEPALGLVELGLEELGGVRRLPLADLQVLLDIEGRERVGDLCHRVRIPPTEAHRERDGGAPSPRRLHSLELDLNIAPRLLDRRLTKARPPPQVRVEVEALDEGLEPRAAQNLLADGLQPGVHFPRHRASDEGLRYLLALHEDRRRRAIEARQRRRDGQGAGEGSGEDEERQEFAPLPHRQRQVQGRGSLRRTRHRSPPGQTRLTAPRRRRRAGGTSPPATHRARSPCCS